MYSPFLFFQKVSLVLFHFHGFGESFHLLLNSQQEAQPLCALSSDVLQWLTVLWATREDVQADVHSASTPVPSLEVGWRSLGLSYNCLITRLVSWQPASHL